MNKVFVNLFTAASLIASSAATVTAKDILPVGGLDTGSMIKYEIETAEEMPQQLPEIELFERNGKPEQGMYSYGGFYGLDYFKKNKLCEEADLYEKIYNRCLEIATEGEDVYSYEMFESEVSAPTQEEASAKLSAFMNAHPELLIQYELENHDVAMDVYATVRSDHPELYWLPSSSFVIDLSYSDGTVVHYIMLFASDTYNEAEERAAADAVMETKIDGWLREVEAAGLSSAYNKVRYVHDLIIDEVDYGYYKGTNTPLNTEYAHSIIGVFDNDPSTDVVCEGYAKAFQLLLNALDIDNVYVTGEGDGGDGNWGGHAWNMVKMDDGEYYNFDVTWDDAGEDREPRYDYFAAGEDFYESHEANTPGGITGTDEFLYELPDVPEYDFIPGSPVRPVPPLRTEDPSDDPTVTENPASTDDPSATDAPFESEMECSLSRNEETGETTVEVKFDKAPENAVAYAARYNSEGILIGIELVNITSEQLSIPVITDGTDVLKIFAWSVGEEDQNRPVARETEIDMRSYTDPAENDDASSETAQVTE